MSDDTTTTAAPAGPPPADPATIQLVEHLGAERELGAAAGAIAQLPAGVKLSTNLDTYEKERPEEPFWFQHGAAFFHLMDPDELDFDDVVIVQEHPRLMLHILLDPQQRGAFADVAKQTPMKVGKMKQLIKAYTQHFGLTDLGELGGSARS